MYYLYNMCIIYTVFIIFRLMILLNANKKKNLFSALFLKYHKLSLISKSKHCFFLLED